MNKADQIAQDMRALGYIVEVTDDKRCIMCAMETHDLEFSIDFEFDAVAGQFRGRLYCMPRHGTGHAGDHFTLMSPIRNSGDLLIANGLLLGRYKASLRSAMAVIAVLEERM